MQTNKITAKSLHRIRLKYRFLYIDNEFKVRFSVGRRHRGPQLDILLLRDCIIFNLDLCMNFFLIGFYALCVVALSFC